MAAEERIRELAYSIWEQEGRPEGKAQEHYLRAKKVLEDQESAARVIQLPASPPAPQLASPTKARHGGNRRRVASG